MFDSDCKRIVISLIEGKIKNQKEITNSFIVEFRDSEPKTGIDQPLLNSPSAHYSKQVEEQLQCVLEWVKKQN